MLFFLAKIQEYIFSHSLLTPFSSRGTTKTSWKKQAKNNPQKPFFEFLHHFLQIPDRTRHESVNLNVNFAPKVVFKHMKIIFQVTDYRFNARPGPALFAFFLFPINRIALFRRREYDNFYPFISAFPLPTRSYASSFGKAILVSSI
jgi:hypothetical protein